MTAADLSPVDRDNDEARIDLAERYMLEANNRTDREFYCRAFLDAIRVRNAERTPEQVAELERVKGLR